MSEAVPREVAAGVWHWSARHPQWHPGAFGAVVGSYALEAGSDGALLVVDPLLPAEEGPTLAALDRLADGVAVHVLVTIGYHVRSAERLVERFGATLWGPPACARRLEDPRRLVVLEPGAPGPAGAAAFAIGRPRRGERPLWLPSHAALAVGDSLVVTPEGDLRLWSQQPVDGHRERWYRDVFAPTLAPLLALPVRHVLATHGPPVLDRGADALRRAVADPPWEHRG